MTYDYSIKCPNCGHDTGIDPALVNPDDPMIYCSQCEEPLFFEETPAVIPIKEEESQDELWEEVADHIRNLTYNQQDENRIASILKSKFHITRKQ